MARSSVSDGAKFMVKNLRSLKPTSESRNTTTSTTSGDQSVKASKALSVKEQAAVDLPAAWVLDRILIQNRVHPKTQKAVRGASAKALVSWLLYALSPGGRGIDRPMNYALARLSEDPQSGAGDRYDELASLPPRAVLQIADKVSRGGLSHVLFTRKETDELAALWIETMGTEKNPALKLMRLLVGNKASHSVTRMTESDRWEQTANGWQHTVETSIEE